MKTYRVVKCNPDGTNAKTLRGCDGLDYIVARRVMDVELFRAIVSLQKVECDTDAWKTDKMSFATYTTDGNTRYELREEDDE